MGDIMSILQSSYLATAATTPTHSNSKYVAVDPKDYEGRWTGTYQDGSSFSLQILNVRGFHATARFQSGSTVAVAQVLIKDSSFHVGDSKFIVTGDNKATMTTAVTSPITGYVSIKSGDAARD